MLITSLSLAQEGPRMSDQIAERDITETNPAGQTVVLVPAGQPIPEHLLERAAGKALDPPENKAKPAPRRRKRAA